MKVERAINIDDLERIAKRRLPRIIYDFAAGGAEDERCLHVNRTAFARRRLIPRYLVDVSRRQQSTSLFGREYGCPFGIGPTGAIGVFRHNGDLMLAEAAKAANIPFVLSMAANCRLEDAVKIAPDHVWCQIYPTRNSSIAEAFIERAKDAGIKHLVVTVDVPVRTKRERNIRNGFKIPLGGLPATIVLEALLHPGWLFDYMRHGGAPKPESWIEYAPPGSSAMEVAAFVESQHPATTQTWRDLERYRSMWPHALVVKGIMHPADASRAASLGVDGIVVSNHGGRQLDAAPSALDMLPVIKTAVGNNIALMLDGGIRRGSDIVIAKCLGADFVLTGRTHVYGVAAGGLAGVIRAHEILRREIDLALGQIGCVAFNQLGPSYLADAEDRAAVPAASV